MDESDNFLRSLNSCDSLGSGRNLLRNLERKFCPLFFSAEDLRSVVNKIQHVLDWNSEDSNKCLPKLCDPTLNFVDVPYKSFAVINVADVAKLMRFAEIVHCSSMKCEYLHVAPQKLETVGALPIIGVLRSQEDGSLCLYDQTGMILCVFFRGSESVANGMDGRKRGLFWSINYLVMIKKFDLILEKELQQQNNIYLIVSEQDVIPVAECLDPKGIYEAHSKQIVVKKNLKQHQSLVSDSEALSAVFGKLSIKGSCTVGLDVSSSVVSQQPDCTVEKLYICQLIVIWKKLLPCFRKYGKKGFRVEAVVISNIRVEDANGTICHVVSGTERVVEKQALEFEDLSRYAAFHYGMVYLFKRPFLLNCKRDLAQDVRRAVCTPVIQVTDVCQFVPVSEVENVCEECRFSEEGVDWLQENGFKLTAGTCICSYADVDVISVSSINTGKSSTKTSFQVRGEILSKSYLDNSSLKLTLGDISSTIDLYVEWKHFDQHLLGLLPGSEVVVSGVSCTMSKYGNVYLKSRCEEFGLRFLRFCPRGDNHPMIFEEVPILPDEKCIPLMFLAQLNLDVRCFRSVSYILKITSISIDPRDPLASKACFLADDGTQQKFITCKGQTVAQLLGIQPAEWCALLHLARACGDDRGLFLKLSSTSSFSQSEHTTPALQFLALLCQRTEVHRQMVLLCRCFPSSSGIRVFCCRMSEGKSVKLCTELLRYVDRFTNFQKKGKPGD